MTEKIVEILQYSLKKGCGQAFQRIMHHISVPLHRRQGIDVVAYGNSRHDADSYYLIRAFENEQQMQSVLDAFYHSEEWRTGPREEIISSIEVSLKSVVLLSQCTVDALRISPVNQG